MVSVAWVETERAKADAHRLVRVELSRAHPSVAPDTWTFARTEADKPFVIGPVTSAASFNPDSALSDASCSYSVSAFCAVCAVTGVSLANITSMAVAIARAHCACVFLSAA